MQKPDVIIESDEFFDYGLSERVARYLQTSPLHVFDAYGFSSVPAAIGDPTDPNTCIDVSLTLLTDGRRGWLVLTPVQDEWNAETEVTDLVEHLLERVPDPPKCVIRAAERFDPCTDGVLDLRAPERIRETIEAEFERHFEGVSAGPVEALLVALGNYRWAVDDELAIRWRMNSW